MDFRDQVDHNETDCVDNISAAVLSRLDSVLPRANPVFQQTLQQQISLTGVGVHSGTQTTVTLHPAKVNSGIKFLCKAQSETGSNIDQIIPAHIKHVGDTQLCTVLGDPKGAHIGTVEHLMAALRSMNIDNALVECEGREVPVMDGSSLAFVKAIQYAGVKQQGENRHYIKILKPIHVENGNASASLLPHHSTQFDVEIKFTSEAIGRQRFVCDLTDTSFTTDISSARTFGFMADALKLRAMGLALGSSFENSVVIDEDKVQNKDGLRFKDEFVRHKLLDAIGDLALAGAPILGTYKSYCGGHHLNSMMLEALFADDANWCFETFEDDASEFELENNHALGGGSNMASEMSVVAAKA